MDSLKQEIESSQRGSDAAGMAESQAAQERERLAGEVERCRAAGAKCTAQRMQLETDVERAGRKLTDNLWKRKAEVEIQLSAMTSEAAAKSNQPSELTGQQIEALKMQLDEANRRVDKARQKLVQADETSDLAARDRRRAAAELEKWEVEERKASANVQEAIKNSEKLANKLVVAQRRAEDCQRQMREVGTVPAEAMERAARLSAKQLMAQLDKCRAELAKLGHVNKKALEQFTHFSEQQEKLTKRREELDKSLESIQELMDVLDQRKFEAVDLTFKQVTKNFADLFARLVPNGRGQLVMIREHDKEDEEQDEAEKAEEEAEARPVKVKRKKNIHAAAVDSFKGISVRVSFGGAVGTEMRELSQLSGGQKTLVALTMIFAIQRCDPAPFYLFDEVDAALDAEYRRAVASVISDLSKTAQFIMTTFRPELLEHADRFYGVRFRNKVSHIQTVTREEAMDFIESEPDLVGAPK